MMGGQIVNLCLEAMNSHIAQIGEPTVSSPWALEIGGTGAWHHATDDPRIAVLAGQVRQDGVGLGSERDDTPPGLRVEQVPLADPWPRCTRRCFWVSVSGLPVSISNRATYIAEWVSVPSRQQLRYEIGQECRKPLALCAAS